MARKHFAEKGRGAARAVKTRTLVSPYGQEYGAVMAGSFLNMLPIMILFLIMQRRFIEGITRGALKG